MATKIFNYLQPFVLESGVQLPGYHLAYTTYGQLNEQRSNVVWIFHALTANSNPEEWWPGLVGEGKLFTPASYFIVCVNMPGSCYGSIGPLDTNVTTDLPYFHEFPFFTPRDMIRAYQPLKEFLGIDKIFIGTGGSMGGQQLLEWAVEEPELFDNIIPIATNAQHSPWGIAFNTSQRMAIEADTSWQQQTAMAGMQGMKAARSIALLSYRHYLAYDATQAAADDSGIENFKAEQYQRYQGEKLAKRFNAFSYYFLSKGMDSHNLGRGRGGVIAALQKIKAKALLIGIETDLLFPVNEQQYLAQHITGGTYKEINSAFGHDGFLVDHRKIETCILEFLAAQKITQVNGSTPGFVPDETEKNNIENQQLNK
jgi:homoserine O-acetyltransferase/O-succinyltransferase